MRNQPPYSIEEMIRNREPIDHNRHLFYRIQKHSAILVKLNLMVKGLLPAPLRHWCRVANIRQGRIMVIETSSAIWMLRLRYEKMALLSFLRAQMLPSLDSIYIRINPNLAINRNKRDSFSVLVKNPRILSLESAEAIRQVASILRPGSLKRTLERFAGMAVVKTNQNQGSFHPRSGRIK